MTDQTKEQDSYLELVAFAQLKVSVEQLENRLKDPANKNFALPASLTEKIQSEISDVLFLKTVEEFLTFANYSLNLLTSISGNTETFVRLNGIATDILSLLN